jgi:hypothetical protein
MNALKEQASVVLLEYVAEGSSLGILFHDRRLHTPQIIFLLRMMFRHRIQR